MLCVHVCVICVWHMHFCQHMEVKVCQFIRKTIASQAVLDVLGTKVWADTFRAHDPLVLHWLVSLGFEKLMTDFATPSPGSALAATTAVPPDARLDLQHAKVDWEAFWRGQLSLKELFQRHGPKVCMVLPERQELTPRLVALVQRSLMPLHMEDNKDVATLACQCCHLHAWITVAFSV